MKLFLDTNVFILENRCHVLITINDNDYKNADQSRIEILTPSAFVEKYIIV